MSANDAEGACQALEDAFTSAKKALECAVCLDVVVCPIPFSPLFFFPSLVDVTEKTISD